MHEETILVTKKWPPNSEKGPGVLVDNQGRRFRAWPDKWALAVEGMSYKIGYTKDDWQGKEQLNIKNLAPAEGAPTPSAAPPRGPTQAVHADKEKHILAAALYKTSWVQGASPTRENMGKVFLNALHAVDWALEAYKHGGPVAVDNIEDTY